MKNIKVIKKKKNKFIKLSILLISFLVFLSLLFIVLFKLYNNKKEIEETEIIEESIDYHEYYFDNIKTLSSKTIYKLIDNKFIEYGFVSSNVSLSLIEDEYLEFGFFKVKDFDFYIDYKDIIENLEIDLVSNNTYLNYIPFNLSLKTNSVTNLYYNDELIYSFNEEMSFPILIKEDNYYGVLYNNSLYYIKKDDCSVYNNINSNLEIASGIATLVYHFTYNSNDQDEKNRCLNSNFTICLSDTVFNEHLSYMKNNGFYTATMNDLELFIDGKINLPKNTVAITIDDGYFVSAAIKVLEKLDMHATLFLIGSAGSPDNYKSNNLEIHSHTYYLHYTGACSGGQGSPLKCLNKDILLEDLRRSREQLNGSTVFCYPFFEYNDYAIEVLKEAGFTMAFAGGRYKIRVGANKYKLPRYGIINTTTINDLKNIIY